MRDISEATFISAETNVDVENLRFALFVCLMLLYG